MDKDRALRILRASLREAEAANDQTRIMMIRTRIEEWKRER